MRKIDRSGQDSQDKKDAGKHDAALDELRKIKGDLSKAGSIEEIKYLILKFNNVAGGIPGELPSDLSDDVIEAVYMDKIAQITDPRQPISEQDLQNGEKAAERALKGLIFINDKLENFLERDDIKASRKRNEAWAKSDRPMTAQETQEFVEDDAKTQDELKLMGNAILATSIKDIVARGREEEEKLQDPKDKEKCREATKQQIVRFVKAAREVNQMFRNRAKIFGKKEVQQQVGKGEAAGRVEEMNAWINGIDKQLDSTVAHLKDMGFEDILMNPEVAPNKDISGAMPDVTKISANMTKQQEVQAIGGGDISPPTLTPTKGQDVPSKGISN